jgi:predicted transcriptional regulator
VKTTVEVPDALFRRFKSAAAERGITFQSLASEALAEKVRSRAEASDTKPWMKSFGKLRHLRKETARVDRIIEEEFETIEPDTAR